jgi:hypothetical protein
MITGERLFLPAAGRAARDAAIEYDSMQEVRLLSFCLDLTMEERIERFDHAVSDESLHWRSSLRSRRYCAIGWESQGRLAAVVELFGSAATGWYRTELAICGRILAGNPGLRIQLVRRGLSAAEALGAAEVVMVCTRNEPPVLELSRVLGGKFDSITSTLVIALPHTVDRLARRRAPRAATAWE